jgi:hypothetical protein
LRRGRPLFCVLSGTRNHSIGRKREEIDADQCVCGAVVLARSPRGGHARWRPRPVIQTLLPERLAIDLGLRRQIFRPTVLVARLVEQRRHQRQRDPDAPDLRVAAENRQTDHHDIAPHGARAWCRPRKRSTGLRLRLTFRAGPKNGPKSDFCRFSWLKVEPRKFKKYLCRRVFIGERGGTRTLDPMIRSRANPSTSMSGKGGLAAEAPLQAISPLPHKRQLIECRLFSKFGHRAGAEAQNRSGERPRKGHVISISDCGDDPIAMRLIGLTSERRWSIWTKNPAAGGGRMRSLAEDKSNRSPSTTAAMEEESRPPPRSDLLSGVGCTRRLVRGPRPTRWISSRRKRTSAPTTTSRSV